MSDATSNHPPFSGTYRHAMDAKHRVTIPSAWRHGEQDQFYLMPSPTNNYLYALPPSEFQKVNEKLNSDPRISASDRRQFARYYFSRALHCVIDRQGRLLLPDEFCRLAGLITDVLLVGPFDRFEVWAPDRWEHAVVDESSTFQQVASLIGA